MTPVEKLALIIMTSNILKHTHPKAAKIFRTGVWCSAKATACQRGLTLPELEAFGSSMKIAIRQAIQTTDVFYRQVVPKEYRGKIIPAGIKSAGNALMSLSGAHCDASETLNYLQANLKKVARILNKNQLNR